MDVRHLRYFLALAEEQHFGRAAARAHIEQSPLSRTITQLEDDLGVPLFIRSRQGTTLTPAGEALREHAREILTAFERARRAVAAVGGLPTVLRIGLSGELAQPRLSDLFHRWREVEPAIPLQITELPSCQQHDALLTEHIDIGLSFGETSSAHVSAEPIWRDPVVVILPHDHALAQAESLTFADIATCTLCHPRSRLGWRSQIDAMLRAEGITPDLTEPADTLPGVIVRVGAGHGIGFLDANIAQTVNRQDVVMIPLAEPVSLAVFALTKRERHDELFLVIRRFIDLASIVGAAGRTMTDAANASCPI